MRRQVEGSMSALRPVRSLHGDVPRAQSGPTLEHLVYTERVGRIAPHFRH